jgi:hypothetical protein
MKRATQYPNPPDLADGTPDGRDAVGGAPRQTLRRRCPLRGDVRAIAGLGNDLAVALRRLKRRLRRCQRTCPAYRVGGLAVPGEPCALLNGFHLQIQAAIATVMEEWDPGYADMAQHEDGTMHADRTRHADVTHHEDVIHREID